MIYSKKIIDIIALSNMVCLKSTICENKAVNKNIFFAFIPARDIPCFPKNNVDLLCEDDFSSL
jgi:hypothetical protein